jgi:hypothetical protein
MISFIQLLMLIGAVILVPLVITQGIQIFKELFNDAK